MAHNLPSKGNMVAWTIAQWLWYLIEGDVTSEAILGSRLNPLNEYLTWSKKHEERTKYSLYSVGKIRLHLRAGGQDPFTKFWKICLRPVFAVDYERSSSSL